MYYDIPETERRSTMGEAKRFSVSEAFLRFDVYRLETSTETHCRVFKFTYLCLLDNLYVCIIANVTCAYDIFEIFVG